MSFSNYKEYENLNLHIFLYLSEQQPTAYAIPFLGANLPIKIDYIYLILFFHFPSLKLMIEPFIPH
jgi:hypothetical protein